MEGFTPDEEKVTNEEYVHPTHSEVENSPEPINEGRRKFLKGMLGAAALGVGGQPLMELLEEEVTPEQLEKELTEYREALKEEYGVELNFDELAESEGSSRELSLAERRDFAGSILRATRLYPKQYVENAGLRLVKGIKWYGDKNSPDPLSVVRGYFKPRDHDQIVISKEHPITYVNDKFGWDNAAKVENVFHHEFYHQSDPHLHDDEFNAVWARESKIHGADFSGVNVGDVFDMRREGFPSSYARTKPSEDRAEVAALLFADPNGIESLAKEEPALREKLDEIKKEYYDRSKGIMDETYWKLLAEDTKKAREYLALRESLVQHVDSE